MTRILKSSLLIGTAILSLSACAGDKGPGAIGSKDDIVVRNHGMPQAAQQAEAPALPQTGDFTSTIEQGEAVPAPVVSAAETLAEQAAVPPVVDPSVAVVAEAPPAVLPPAAVPSVPAPQAYVAAVPPAPVPLPVQPPLAQPQTEPAVIPPMPESAPAVTGGVYPAADYAAPPVAPPVPVPSPYEAPAVAAPVSVPAPYEAPVVAAPPVVPPVAAPVAQPVTLPEGVKYPLDPNAPYSPKAVEAAVAAAGASVPASAAAVVSGNPSDSVTIRAAQTALKARGLYSGAETGVVDAAFLNALILYQGQQKLPQGGLNEATLRSLGVIQ